jgi:hypothetical protein
MRMSNGDLVAHWMRTRIRPAAEAYDLHATSSDGGPHVVCAVSARIMTERRSEHGFASLFEAPGGIRSPWCGSTAVP